MTSLACSDILACGEDARFEVQGFLVGSPVRAIDGSKSLHTTLENKLFVSLSVKVTVYLASDVVFRLNCAFMITLYRVQAYCYSLPLFIFTSGFSLFHFFSDLVFIPSEIKIAPHKYPLYSQNQNKNVVRFSLPPDIHNVYLLFWFRLFHLYTGSIYNKYALNRF